MFGIGAGELLIILIAGLVIFGPGKLPEVGRAIGKGLREFRKAQAMFRATLDEVDLENKEKIVALEKKSSAENVSTDKAITADKNISTEKKTAFSVYDVIEMSKNNTFVKEKVHEKIFGGNGAVTYDADVSKCINITRGGTDGTGK